MAEIIWGSVVFQDHYISKGKSWDWEEENLCKEQESVESNKEPTLDLLRNGRHVANLTLVGQPIKQESSCWSTAADSNLQFRSKLKANVSDGWCWLSLLQVVHTWRWLYLKKKVCGIDVHLINSGDHPQHCEVNPWRSHLLRLVIWDCTPSVYVALEFSGVHSRTLPAEQHASVHCTGEQRLSAIPSSQRHKCSR